MRPITALLTTARRRFQATREPQHAPDDVRPTPLASRPPPPDRLGPLIASLPTLPDPRTPRVTKGHLWFQSQSERGLALESFARQLFAEGQSNYAVWQFLRREGYPHGVTTLLYLSSELRERYNKRRQEAV